MNPDLSSGDYGVFCAMVTAYRQLEVVLAAVDSGIIDAVASGPCTIEQLLAATGVKSAEGERFVGLLLSAGLLQERDGLLHLSPFAADYLRRDSDRSQRGGLEFERLLQRRWQGLTGQLTAGQGSVVEEHSPEEYRQRLGLFHRAMHEAAAVRSAELWDAVGPIPEQGLIIDVGAGDGTYLRSFLGRHPAWHGVACDLGDVLAGRASDAAITPWPCNLLDPGERQTFVTRHRGRADLLLLSNFIHCYSTKEVAAMLPDLGELVAPGGMVVIHDFFTDGNGFSALYDLHMLVNTYNGRTYSFAEAGVLLAGAGFTVRRTLALPSMSHVLIARRETR